MNGTKVREFVRRNQGSLGYLAIFIISFLVFFYLQYHPALADPDSFYHARLSLLIKDQGIIRNFPWLGQFTILKNYYTDHHFLYHLLVIPFVAFLPPTIGIKFLTVVLGSLGSIGYYWFLKRFKVKLAWLFTLIPLVSGPFLFRMSLGKANGLSFIFLLLGLYAILKSRYKLLFILSFFYVWAYAGFPLFLGFLFFYFLATLILALRNSFGRPNWRALLKTELRIKDNLKLLAGCLGGLSLGIVVNPFFPKNLHFYWYQTIKVAIINYQKIIGVGGEWYPYKITDLISGTSLMTGLAVIVLTLFFINFKKQSLKTITLFFIAIFFLVFTLKSRRNVEYLVPFMTLFLALSFSDSFKEMGLTKLINLYKKYYLQKPLLVILLTVYFSFSLLFIPVRDLKGTRGELAAGHLADEYKQASLWLEENTPAGATVFHSDWDEFPILFYQNPHNYYIVGLDSTFMYEYDKDLYWQFVKITTGEETTNLAEKIKNNFKASYVFLTKDHIKLDQALENDKNFSLKFEDDETKVYEINP